MSAQLHLVEHGQELLPGSLGLEVGDHLGREVGDGGEQYVR